MIMKIMMNISRLMYRCFSCCEVPLVTSRRCFSLTSLSPRNKTLYDILGVSRRATKRDIRTAFLALSKTHHPDMSRNKDANLMFMEINEAYNTLCNPAKRYQYDMHLYTIESSAGSLNHRHSSPFTHAPSRDAYQYAHNYYNLSEEEWTELYQKSTPQPNHARVIVGLIIMMIVASAVHSYRIRMAHKQIQERSDLETQRNIQVYNSVRKRAASSSVSEQLERLTNTVGKR